MGDDEICPSRHKSDSAISVVAPGPHLDLIAGDPGERFQNPYPDPSLVQPLLLGFLEKERLYLTHKDSVFAVGWRVPEIATAITAALAPPPRHPHKQEKPR